VIEWIQANEELVWWLSIASAVTFLATLILGPLLIARVPHDYFSHRRRRAAVLTWRHPVIRLLVFLVRNVLGLVLLVAGVLMLVLPGQGLLTIVAAIVVAEFPGKYRLERWIVSHRSIRNAIDWLRRRAGRRPLVVDD